MKYLITYSHYRRYAVSHSFFENKLDEQGGYRTRSYIIAHLCVDPSWLFLENVY